MLGVPVRQPRRGAVARRLAVRASLRAGRPPRGLVWSCRACTIPLNAEWPESPGAKRTRNSGHSWALVNVALSLVFAVTPCQHERARALPGETRHACRNHVVFDLSRRVRDKAINLRVPVR